MDAEEMIAGKPLDYLRRLPIDLSLNPPDGVNVEAVCVALSVHPDVYVRGNAVLGFGHLARTLGALDEATVMPIVEAALRDEAPFVCGHAASAVSDLRHFLGWKFRRTRPRILPPGAREIRAKAVYRVYLILDELSNILVERQDLPGVTAPSDEFPPDPRGLSHGYEWRLPGFSLMQPLLPKAAALEVLWEERRKAFADDAAAFEERAIVQAKTLQGAADHKYLDWLEISCRALRGGQTSNDSWPPDDGVAQRWLTAEEFMAGFPVGAHDRYAYALFEDFTKQR